jgi:hypothetical protein
MSHLMSKKVHTGVFIDKSKHYDYKNKKTFISDDESFVSDTSFSEYEKEMSPESIKKTF